MESKQNPVLNTAADRRRKFLCGGGGGDEVSDGEKAMKEAEDPTDGEDPIVRKTTRLPRLGVRHDSDDEHRESYHQCDPERRKKQSVGGKKTVSLVLFCEKTVCLVTMRRRGKRRLIGDWRRIVGSLPWKRRKCSRRASWR